MGLWHRLCQWFHECTFISKLIRLYTLIMHRFWYVKKNFAKSAKKGITY